MASRLTWENYRSTNPDKGTDEDIQSMIKDVVETIHTLERMYGTANAQLVVRALLVDWHTLAQIAGARGLTYERP